MPAFHKRVVTRQRSVVVPEEQIFLMEKRHRGYRSVGTLVFYPNVAAYLSPPIRLVPFLKEGARVVTTRGHVHWVVTEYGIVNLFGKNLKQWAKALIHIAYPNHQERFNKSFVV